LVSAGLGRPRLLLLLLNMRRLLLLLLLPLVLPRHTWLRPLLELPRLLAPVARNDIGRAGLVTPVDSRWAERTRDSLEHSNG
jgi:hypothetical protein